MGYSAWKIWFHPQLTQQVMADIEAQMEADHAELEALRVKHQERACELSEVKGRLAVLEKENDGLRRELEDMTARESDCKRELAEMVASLEATGAENVSLRARLKEQAEAEDLLREVDEKMRGVADMRAAYEKRITRLRDEIVRLKKASGSENPEANDLREIDMRGPAIYPWERKPEAKEPEDEKPKRKTKDDGDWLELL